MITAAKPDWKATKPSQPGWYKTTTPAEVATVNLNRALYRWWDGAYWSVGVSRNADAVQAGKLACMKVSSSFTILWTESEIVERAE